LTIANHVTALPLVEGAVGLVATVVVALVVVPVVVLAGNVTTMTTGGTVVVVGVVVEVVVEVVLVVVVLVLVLVLVVVVGDVLVDVDEPEVAEFEVAEAVEVEFTGTFDGETEGVVVETSVFGWAVIVEPNACGAEAGPVVETPGCPVDEARIVEVVVGGAAGFVVEGPRAGVGSISARADGIVEATPPAAG
jgi:hypothetical protein